MKNSRKAVVGAASMATLTALALMAAPVSADPVGAPTYRVLTFQGSDTTQDVMNGFAESVVAGTNQYFNTGLLFDATIVGATSIRTSLLPTVGDTIEIGTGGGTAESVVVSAVTATATANTLTSGNGTGDAIPYNTVTLATGLVNAHAANEIVKGSAIAAGTLVLASYNSQGGAFQSKANANCQYIANNGGAGNYYTGTTQNNSVQTGTTANSTYLSGGRSNGSGNGARAMADSYTKTNGLWGCTDVARASSKRSNVTGLGAGNAVNIPFAIDGTAFAVTTTSNFPRVLSPTDLKAIYRCTYPGMIPATATIPVGTSVQQYAADNGLLYATLPQAGSGTRDFIRNALGLTESATVASGNTGAACITDKTPSGGVLEEHDLRTIDDNGIGVTSIAQSITQRSQAVAGVTDRQGRTVLVTLDNTSAANAGTPVNNGKISIPVEMTPQVGGGSGTTAGAMVMWRDVFNVVPLNRLNDPNIQAALVGNTSALCVDADGVRAKYGFAANPNCGITTNLG